MKTEVKSIDAAAEVRKFDHGRVELTTVDEVLFTRSTLQPGWVWSKSVKPVAGTESCQVAHTGYCVAGRLHVTLDDGTELEVNGGDAYAIPPGHDAEVLDAEPWIGVDVSPAMANFAKG